MGRFLKWERRLDKGDHLRAPVSFLHAAFASTVIFFCSAAYAAPGKTIQYLMNEPANLLDIGMLKANVFVESKSAELAQEIKWPFDPSQISGSAIYSPDRDVINVNLNVIYVEELNRSFAENFCKGLYGRWLELNHLNDPEVAPIIWGEFFAHEPSASNYQPELWKKVAEILKPQVSVWNKNHARVSCFGTVGQDEPAIEFRGDWNSKE